LPDDRAQRCGIAPRELDDIDEPTIRGCAATMADLAAAHALEALDQFSSHTFSYTTSYSVAQIDTRV
jgi:hypothetical protein